jgi:hypothetical protein
MLKIFQELELADGEITAENIKNIYLGKASLNYSLLQLFDKAVEKYTIEIKKGSLKNYHATRSYVQAYCRGKYRGGDVLLRHLTYAFIDELKTYILTHPIKSNDPCTNNGCMKHLERLKKIVTWGYQMRFMDRDVFASFKIKMKRRETERLNWKQLQQIQGRV